MASSGEPRRCDSKLPCDRGSMCRFSEVLWLDICCRPSEERIVSEENSEESMSARRASNPFEELDPQIEFQSDQESRRQERPKLALKGSTNRRGNKQPTKCKLSYSNGETISDECKKVVFPGEDGCDDGHPCTGQSRCVQGKCFCHPRAVLFNKMCYWKCPLSYRNASGICV